MRFRREEAEGSVFASPPSADADEGSKMPRLFSGKAGPFGLHWASMAVSFTLPMAIYTLTACRTVYWGDTGEFLVAAIGLGIPHSPGTPLYPLLGRVFSLLPLAGTVLWVNLMSAFFASVSALLVYFIVLHASLARESTSRSCAIAGGLVASLVWAFTNSLWSYSTVAEVYTLQLAFVCGLTLIGLKLHLPKGSNLSLLPLFFFLFGLSLTNNITVLLLAFAFAVLIWRPFFALGAKWKTLVLFLFVLGLTPYLYMPLRSIHNPAIDWGNPETTSQFMWVLTAREFSRNMLGLKYALTGGIFKAFMIYLKLLLSDISTAGLVLSIIGAVSLFLTSKRILLFFALMYVINLAYSFAFGADLELEAYLLPSLLVLVVLLGMGAARLVSFGRKRFGLLIFAVVLLTPLTMLISRYEERDLKGNSYAEETGNGLISSIDEGAPFFTENTVDLFTALYVQSIKGVRPDVPLIYLPYLKYEWYREQVAQRFGMDIPQNEVRLIELMQAKGAYYTPLDKITIPYNLLIPDGIRFKVVSDSLTSDLISASDSRMASIDFDRETKDYDTRRHFAMIHSYLGEYFFLGGRSDLSSREYHRAAEIMPKNSEIQLNLAIALERSGRLDEAFSAYQRCFSLGGNRLRILKGLGKVSLKLENAAAARDYLLEAASLDVTDAFIFYNLGLAHLKMGDFRAAAKANLKAIELKPLFPEVHVNLGISYLNMGQLPQAVAHLRKAISADSVHIPAYINLAQVYVFMDSLETAMAVLEAGAAGAASSRDLRMIEGKLMELRELSKSLDKK